MHKHPSFRRIYCQPWHTRCNLLWTRFVSHTVRQQTCSCNYQRFKGNTIELLRKPINAGLGHGVAAMAGDPKAIERFAYYYAASYETAKRAVAICFIYQKGFMNPDERISFVKTSKNTLTTRLKSSTCLHRPWKRKCMANLWNCVWRRLCICSVTAFIVQWLVCLVLTKAPMCSCHVDCTIRAYDNVFSKFGYVDEKFEAEHEVFKTCLTAGVFCLTKQLKMPLVRLHLTWRQSRCSANNATISINFATSCTSTFKH